MAHLADGALRRLYDEPHALVEKDRRHYDSCPDCRERFSRIWPTRHEDFSNRMNAAPKLVASRSLDEVDGWSNSSLLRGDLVQEVTRRKREQDLVVAGSAGVLRTLMERDLVDEYRLLVFPTVLGEGGRRLAAL